MKNEFEKTFGNLEEVPFVSLVNQAEEGLDFVGDKGGHVEGNGEFVDSMEGIQVPSVKIPAKPAEPSEHDDTVEPAEPTEPEA